MFWVFFAFFCLSIVMVKTRLGLLDTSEVGRCAMLTGRSFSSSPGICQGIAVCFTHQPVLQSVCLLSKQYWRVVAGDFSAPALSLFDTCIHIFREILLDMHIRRTLGMHAEWTGSQPAHLKNEFQVHLWGN